MLMEESRVCRASKSKYILAADTTVTISHLFFKRRKKDLQDLSQQQLNLFWSTVKTTKREILRFQSESNLTNIRCF